VDDEVRIVSTAQTHTAVVAKETTWDEFPQVCRTLLDEVWTFLRKSDLTAGRNVMLYKDDLPRVEVGAEVDRSFAASGRVVPSSLPAGQAATTVARGAPSPEGLARAHALALDWCSANDRKVTGVRWEIYGHWLENQDPALFETEVYWLLEP
jgi:hypothetical protein